MMAALRSANVKHYHATEETNFIPDIAELERLCTPATKLLLINTPLNPIGSVIPLERMRQLLDFAAAHDLWVLSDEAYEALTYTDTFVSAASLHEADRVIGVYSFSKSYAMTGFRLGYMALPPTLVTLVGDLQEAMFSCASAPAEWAALAALNGPQGVVEEMRQAYADRRGLALKALAAHNVSAYPPEGAFYLWIDIRPTGVASKAFVTSLLEKHKVAVVPGSDFGPSGEGYLRASLASAPEAIVEGLTRLGRHFQDQLGNAEDATAAQ
jgi:aspartate/methionine/tyrosine aminotransferase